MYFLQPVSCGTKDETHTVREWLSSFDLLESDAWFQLWQKSITKLSPLMRTLEKKLSENILDELRSILFFEMYLHYQAEQDFLPQFEANTLNLTGLLKRLDSKAC